MDLSRTELLLGQENMNRIKKSNVAVFGLGGVGGASFMSLLRSGFGSLTVVDFDVVESSNLNRQMLFDANDIGKKKVEIAANWPSKLGFDCRITAIDKKVDENFFESFSIKGFDFVIDAIDDVNGKLAIAKECVAAGVPFVCCLGMGNRVDPSKIEITTLDKTHDDPLAKKIRKAFKEEGIDADQVAVAFSSEMPAVKSSEVPSMMFVPNGAGLLMSSYCLQNILGKEPLSACDKSRKK